MKIAGLYISRVQPPTVHDEFHEYTADISQLNKQRDGLLQKIMLSGKDEPRQAQLYAELQRCETMIECAQKAIIELKEREARKAAAK
jgi:hypothetical protein